MKKILYILIFCLLYIYFISTAIAENEFYNEWNSYRIENGLLNNYVSTIAIDIENIKWVGHRGNAKGQKGISVYDDVKWLPFIESGGKVIAVDNYNVKWFNSGFNIVSYNFKYNAQDYMIEAYLEEHTMWSYEPLVGGEIIKIIIDKNNIKWVVGAGDTEYNAYVSQYDGVSILHRDIFTYNIID